MKNLYAEMQEHHQMEINAFPMFFAFSQKQFEEGMKSLGLEPSATDQIYSLGNGGYYKKSDATKLHEMFRRFKQDQEDAISADTTGEGFIFDMFSYELDNHEYCITLDLEDTLDAIGMTQEEISASPRLKRGLKLALNRQSNL